MKYPFFASFIVFCIWLGYEIHKRRNKDAKITQSFWEQEAAANKTRRKPLDSLNYIHIPFETLPMDLLSDDSEISEYHQTLRDLSASPIVNLTGISNTELKLQYGAPNIDLLSNYDQSYTMLVRTLQNWAAALYAKDYVQEAGTILTFAMDTHTDISASYRLLATIYQKNGTPERIQELVQIAETLNSVMKKPILAMLENFTTAAHISE